MKVNGHRLRPTLCNLNFGFITRVQFHFWCLPLQKVAPNVEHVKKILIFELNNMFYCSHRPWL